MDNIQTNTKYGILTLASGNLEGKEGLLVKLTQTGLSLPSALTDNTAYVVVDGGATESAVLPLNGGEQVRVFIKGSCSMGDLLCAADPSTPADAGKVRAVPVANGVFRIVGIAEEAAVDGQAVLMRAVSFEKRVVAFASGNLEGKEGLLVKLGSTGLALPTALTDDLPYIVVEGGASKSAVQPLVSGEQVEAIAKGSCSMGDLLCAADPSTPADAGKVRAVPAANGTYTVVGIAEAAATDGGKVPMRAFHKVVTISA